MNVVILLAGGVDGYQQSGSAYPKNLAEIADRPLVQHVLEGLLPLKELGARFVCMIPGPENRRFHTGSVIQLIEPDAVVIEVPETTAGAACTAMLAVEWIDNGEPLMVINGDIVLDGDLVAMIRDFQTRSLDAGIVVFEDVHPRWSFVKLNAGGMVVEAAEKRPISRFATTGLYWFARGADFMKAAAAMLRKGASVDGLFYVSPVLNEMILAQARIEVTQIDKSGYHSLKDPAGARAYEQVLQTQASSGPKS
jgi:dTDP-glucose pyrophosphorylase